VHFYASVNELQMFVVKKCFETAWHNLSLTKRMCLKAAIDS
jgi:hypothetical protein